MTCDHPQLRLCRFNCHNFEEILKMYHTITPLGESFLIYKPKNMQVHIVISKLMQFNTRKMMKNYVKFSQTVTK